MNPKPTRQTACSLVQATPHRQTSLVKQRIGLALLGFILSLASSCAVTPLTPQQIQSVERAVESRNPDRLRGTMRRLYHRRIDQIAITKALQDNDSSSLTGRQRSEYHRQHKLRHQQKSASLQNQQSKISERQKLKQSRNKQQKPVQKLQENQAELANNLFDKKRQTREQRFNEAITLQKSVPQEERHAWHKEMEALTEFFKAEGYEPAYRLADRYSLTNQYLMYANPSKNQFASYYGDLSKTEKLDYHRLFNDPTGTELVEKFWISRAQSLEDDEPVYPWLTARTKIPEQ